MELEMSVLVPQYLRIVTRDHNSQQLELVGPALSEHFLQEARLAEPGTADEDRATLRGRLCLAEKAGQEVEDVVAANEGRQAATGRCLKSPGRRASSQPIRSYRPDSISPSVRSKVPAWIPECMRSGISAGDTRS